MKTNYALVALVGILSSSFMLTARELRTPLTLQSTFGRAYVHYPVPRPKENDTCWNFDVIGAAFARSTDLGFINKDSTKKESLAALWFGQENFTGGNAFAPGSTGPAATSSVNARNPFLNFATISPRFDYNEKGAWFHLTVDRALCGGRWHVGTRINVPFRSIKVELDSCCALEETLADVRAMSNERVTDEYGDLSLITNQQAYAYRLDFLASLKTTSNAPLVNLFNFNTQKVQTVLINEMNTTVVGNPTYKVNPVNFIFREDGSVPLVPFSLRGEQLNPTPVQPIPVDTLSNLNADGTGIFTQVTDDGATSRRAVFNSTVNYAALSKNVANQSKLWMVPTVVDIAPSSTTPPTGTTVLHTDADVIGTNVEAVINSINTSAVGFLNSQGVSFETQRTVGIGDLDWDFYAQRHWCHQYWGYLYAEGLVGVRFPLAKPIGDPQRLLKVAAGNNRHYELRAGLQGGWEPFDWLNMKADGVYAWAFRHPEKVAAPFTGATVKNIGPTIQADVAWGYFMGNLDFTFVAPCSGYPVGIDVGYNVYIKGKDRITLKQTTAVDFFGVTQPLDAAVLQEYTNVVAHKIKTEAFHQGDSWEIYGGWSIVVAGKNATRDTDWHLGLSVFF